MRDLIVTENITLDGVIEATEGWFEPAGADPEIDQTDVIETVRRHSEAADAFLVGWVTFVEMRGFWPHQTADTTGVSDYLNRVSKYVVSGSLHDPEWENTTVLTGPVRDEIDALKSRPGKDIVTTGSITLVRSLIAAGLVDEDRLFVYPVVLGRGERLFADAPGVPELRLKEAHPFRNGTVLLRYRTA
jgi:dihydrofolate reductase